MTNPMIEVKQLRKEFGPFLAVDDISFSVAQGEVLGFLGPNGAGKSTTMKMITGFLAPSAGTAAVCGQDIVENPIAAKAKIGYLPEGAPAYGDMTPWQFLRFIAELRGYRGSELARRVGEAAEKVNLQSVLHKTIDTLSKGFKRRVGLAQAILHDPPVLILDEPTDGLDPNQKHEVRELIKAMSREKAIVISTHILEEVQAVCTRAVIIAQGKLLFDGTPEKLLAQSATHNAVSLMLSGANADEVERQLRDIDAVAKVARQAQVDGRLRFTVFPRNGTPIIHQVSELARTRGWSVDGLHVESGRLDDVFRHITTESSELARGTLS